MTYTLTHITYPIPPSTHTTYIWSTYYILPDNTVRARFLSPLSLSLSFFLSLFLSLCRYSRRDYCSGSQMRLQNPPGVSHFFLQILRCLAAYMFRCIYIFRFFCVCMSVIVAAVKVRLQNSAGVCIASRLVCTRMDMHTDACMCIHPK